MDRSGIQRIRMCYDAGKSLATILILAIVCIIVLQHHQGTFGCFFGREFVCDKRNGCIGSGECIISSICAVETIPPSCNIIYFSKDAQPNLVGGSCCFGFGGGQFAWSDASRMLLAMVVSGS
jgi:hypothetical protein